MPPKKAAPKKGETIPDENSFSGIQLESKSVATLVLMLKGNEGPIVKNSVEALYKYADKSNENKIDLFSKNSVPLLFNLLLTPQNNGMELYGEVEFALIKRFSAMTIGVLSSILEVRKLIKKNPNWISQLINQLIQNQEISGDQVIVEFICLIFANLSQEFTGKVVLANVEDDRSKLPNALVNLLPHTDPDIIHNSCRCLKNLAEDFENLAIIRKEERLEEHLLDLLNSSYPMIQKCSLSLLENISKESTSANKIGDLQGISKLIEILASDKVADLHELTLNVLANCFRVSKLLAEARNQGALLRLLQMSGRETGKSTNESGTLQPEVMAALAKAFENIAMDRTNADILVDEKIDATMLKYLNYDDNKVKAAAARAVSTLSKNVFFKESFALNGIEAIVKLLKLDNDSIEAALLALSVLMLNCTANINLTVKCFGVDDIIHILNHTKCDSVVLNGLAALRSLSLDGKARQLALNHGCLKSTIGKILTNFPSTEVKTSAANTLTSYLTDQEARTDFGSSKNNVISLLKLLEADSPDLREAGAHAIHAFASEPSAAEELAANKALALLQAAAIKQPNSKIIQQAFEKLLDHHLSVKYSICGKLHSTDKIEDGFYDTGCKFINGGTGQQDGTVFPNIDELAKEDISHVRAIIFVNSGESRISAEKEENHPKQKRNSGKKPTKDTTKETKKDTPRKKQKSAKDKNTDDKDLDTNTDLNESLTNKETISFNPLDDDLNLQKFYNDIQNLINYKHTMTDQCKIIADYVSNIMGGKVTPKTIDDIAWQVHQGEKKLKYKSNVIPIGDIQLGTFTHRSLLFKVLADKIGLPVSLYRGNYNRAWNEIILPNEGVHRAFVIDLMFDIGKLMRSDSGEGNKYKSL